MATTTEKLVVGSTSTVMTNTNLSALATTALFLSSAYNNLQAGGSGDGYTKARIEFTLTMATAATANTGFALWILKSNDNSTFEAGSTSYTPLRLPDVVCPAPVDTTQRVVSFDVDLPVGYLKFLIKNDSTGNSLKTDVTSAGSQVTVTPYTRQMV